MNTTQTWIGKAQERLCVHAAKCFAQWRETKHGQRWWKASGGGRKANVSPYKFGFVLPDYHHEIIKALCIGDEERVKGLILMHDLF